LTNPGGFLALILKDAGATEGIAARHKVDATLGKKTKPEYVHRDAISRLGQNGKMITTSGMSSLVKKRRDG
jgi:hypothetical protein